MIDDQKGGKRLVADRENMLAREKAKIEAREAARVAKLKKMPVISPDSIRFNYDSYIPTASTYNRFKSNRINQYNSYNTDKKIEDVYIITYSNKAASEKSSDLKRQESALFHV
ncbi:hypothetical protein ACFS7Z_08745 [Pontibacter toksunensis]|uniref:Uncharacterized protein n=1 Tax=Pontibacter toksunensis TaxID=1332631 RepID=A0ABW6BUC0_9BACT